MSEQTAERATTEPETQTSRRPFRAADVLTGSIDKRRQTSGKTRKQISAQLDPNQLRILGELHARLNATADKRIEKSDLVGLGIELLAAVLRDVDGRHDPAPDGSTSRSRKRAVDDIRDVDDIRSYMRTHVRVYADGKQS